MTTSAVAATAATASEAGTSGANLATGNRESADERDIYIAVLCEFSALGFRKASMSTLAEAAGVARQTLYNRFGNKEAVLDWSVTGLSSLLQEDALACLQAGTGKPAAEVLEDFFWALLGPVTLMLQNGRHAEEILGLSKATLYKSQPDPLAGYGDGLSAFLLSHTSQSARGRDAADTAFLLVMAAKGLMQTCAGEIEFRSGIRRAIAGAGI